MISLKGTGENQIGNVIVGKGVLRMSRERVISRKRVIGNGCLCSMVE